MRFPAGQRTLSCPPHDDKPESNHCGQHDYGKEDTDQHDSGKEGNSCVSEEQSGPRNTTHGRYVDDTLTLNVADEPGGGDEALFSVSAGHLNATDGHANVEAHTQSLASTSGLDVEDIRALQNPLECSSVSQNETSDGAVTKPSVRVMLQSLLARFIEADESKVLTWYGVVLVLLEAQKSERSKK